MEIIIHRGTNQIGGCATEIRTDTTRIFIDFGAELDSDARALNIQGVTRGTTNCHGVFFTHYHMDHMGLLNTINSDIPLYIGKASKEIIQRLNRRIKKYEPDLIKKLRTYEAPSPIIIGDIVITPLFVDHSAYDAHMFLIETRGKRILHTGDFRAHGFRGKGLLPTLQKYVKKVDALLCEGTTLNRFGDPPITEQKLKKQLEQAIRENKYIFVLCSSTNIDRVASVCASVPSGKYCICDDYQYELITYIRKVAGEKSSFYRCERVLRYRQNLDEKMKNSGFCMFVRSGNPFHRMIMEQYPDAVVIYSMWKGYLQQEAMQNFLAGFRRLDLHTSGHADRKTIRDVIEKINPKWVIPLHTEVPHAFTDLVGEREILLPQDGEILMI